MDKKMNKRGFTLVELLVVIVVLAIIMVIAAPLALNAMNSAKKRSFVLYGQRVVSLAQTAYQTYSLLGEANPYLIRSGTSNNYCINVKNLGQENVGSFKGYILIEGVGVGDTTGKVKYTVYLTDATNYTFNGVTSDQISASTAAEGTTITVPTGYPGCYSGE